MVQWNIKKKYINGDDIIKLILDNRGLSSPDKLESFLNPPPVSKWIAEFPEEFKESLKCARQLVSETISAGIPIIIHGDYDADGISATTILYSTLKKELGYENTHFFIPNRFKHGYGLSKESLAEIAEKYKTGLIITVDCGITAVDEVANAKKLGFKVIITDHHQKPHALPDADCIVWSDKVVGSSVSWILSRVLGSKSANSIVFAGIATVTDLQQVLDMNRTILKKALEVLNTDPPLGLKKLLEVAGKPVGKITSYDLGWLVGPRLNASGRLVDAEDALKLMLTDDEVEAHQRAWDLNSVNATRQDKTLEMFEIASTLDNAAQSKLIFTAKPEYHEGIIGLVASKLAQKYYRPAIVISIFDDKAKGSVRSVPGVNIIEMLRQFEDLFESLGGHPMAAGFSLKLDKLPELEDKILKAAQDQISEEQLIKKLNIDLELPTELINVDLLDKLQMLEPYGIGNEEPIFCTKNLKISSVGAVGKDNQHLSLKFYDNGNTLKAIHFGAGERAAEFKMGDTVDIAYTLNRNEYQGRVSADLIIKDIVKH